MEEKMRYFGSKVDVLIKGLSLDRSESRDLFSQILLNEQPDLQQGAFLAAITAKALHLKRSQENGRPSTR